MLLSSKSGRAHTRFLILGGRKHQVQVRLSGGFERRNEGFCQSSCKAMRYCMSYQNPLLLAAVISSSGFVQIPQRRSKVSSWGSPKQVCRLEQILVQLQGGLRRARVLMHLRFYSWTIRSTKIFRNSVIEWDGRRKTFREVVCERHRKFLF